MPALLTHRPQRPASGRAPAVRARPTAADIVSVRKVRPLWYRRSAVCVGLGLTGWGGLPLVGAGEWADFALGAGVATSVAAAGRGEQSRRRGQVAADVTSALVSVAGPVTLRMTRWRAGWVGTPGRVRVDYLPEVDDSVPGWTADVAAVVGRRVGQTPDAYTVDRHDRRRRRVWLQLDTAGDQPVRTAQQVRTKRIVREVLGTTATVRLTWGDDETLTAVQVEHEAGVRVATSAQRARIERIVSTMLPGRWRAHWDMETDRVRFEMRPTLPRFVPNPAEELTAENRLMLPYGVDEDGHTMVWNLAPNAVEPHHLVVGTTGSGKSAELNGIIMAAARRGFAVYITDPKRIEFMGLRDWPNVVIVATAVEEMVAVVHKMHELMEERYLALENGQASEADFEPVILVLDEFRNFHRLVTAWYAATKVSGMPSKCPIFDEVAAIAEKGRSAHVHLAIGSQRPDAQWLGGSMRDVLRSRVSMGRLSPQGAMMMWDAAYIGVAIPRGLPGRATAMSPDDSPVEVQAYWTPDPRRTGPDRPDDQAILDRLRPTSTVHAPMVVQPPPAEDVHEKTGEHTYYDWTRVKLVPAGTLSKRAAISVTKSYGMTPDAQSDAEPTQAVDEREPTREEDGYGDRVEVRVSSLTAGDLVLVDEDCQVWAAVEASEGDLLEEGYWCVDWRDDAGDAGSISLPEDEMVTARHPVEADTEDLS